ncbi:uncharacterized protein BDR25DRAFT_346566 [Lindgomyces ingoldianus]|uniref:Uncharacterized protein n=1 Tax=Lindgomyces ingoldianus TaxID=673940 RepID=A0ACB6QEI8_9PLEO|nr:uncharacterized protein BDR25DRAFT_346566 [Lindgomyces ingoldianus]KAF2464772.1 hypothetical protein BDR25DRAFT_346566 [Lindgomyces ingoldianus]
MEGSPSPELDPVIEGHIKALLSLSNNPIYADPRKLLLKNLKTGEIDRILAEVWTYRISRTGREAIATVMLDVIAKEDARPMREGPAHRPRAGSEANEAGDGHEEQDKGSEVSEDGQEESRQSGHDDPIQGGHEESVQNREATQPIVSSEADADHGEDRGDREATGHRAGSTFSEVDLGGERQGEEVAQPEAGSKVNEVVHNEEKQKYEGPRQAVDTHSYRTRTSIKRNLGTSPAGRLSKRHKTGEHSRQLSENNEDGEERGHIPQPSPSAEPLIRRIPQPRRGRPSNQNLTNSNPDLELLLWVPSLNNTGEWKPITSLPRGVNENLRTRFFEDYTFHKGKKYRYAQMTRNPDTYIDNGRCVHNLVSRKASSVMTYNAADGNIHRTCDLCFQAGKLCARLVRLDGEVKMGLFPVPGGLRRGLRWSEIGYWIGQEGSRKREFQQERVKFGSTVPT